MEVLGVIRWVIMGFFVVLFYFSEIKKRKEFEIPAHFAILLAVLLHAIVRDWSLIMKIIIITVGIAGVGGNIVKLVMQKKEAA